jgi:hypothetical protein
MKTEHIVIIVIIILVLALIYRDTGKNSEHFDPSGNQLITTSRDFITDFRNRLNAITRPPGPAPSASVPYTHNTLIDGLTRIPHKLTAYTRIPEQDRSQVTQKINDLKKSLNPNIRYTNLFNSVFYILGLTGWSFNQVPNDWNMVNRVIRYLIDYNTGNSDYFDLSGNQPMTMTISRDVITDLINRLDAITRPPPPPPGPAPSASVPYNHNTLIGYLTSIPEKADAYRYMTYYERQNLIQKVNNLKNSLNPNIRYTNLFNAAFWIVNMPTWYLFAPNPLNSIVTNYIINYNTSLL